MQSPKNSPQVQFVGKFLALLLETCFLHLAFYFYFLFLLEHVIIALCSLQMIYDHLMAKTHRNLQRKLSVYLNLKMKDQDADQDAHQDEDQDADQDGDEPLMEEHTMKQMNRAYARLLLASGFAHRCPSDEKV